MIVIPTHAQPITQTNKQPTPAPSIPPTPSSWSRLLNPSVVTYIPTPHPEPITHY